MKSQFHCLPSIHSRRSNIDAPSGHFQRLKPAASFCVLKPWAGTAARLMSGKGTVCISLLQKQKANKQTCMSPKNINACIVMWVQTYPLKYAHTHMCSDLHYMALRCNPLQPGCVPMRCIALQCIPVHQVHGYMHAHMHILHLNKFLVNFLGLFAPSLSESVGNKRRGKRQVHSLSTCHN